MPPSWAISSSRSRRPRCRLSHGGKTQQSALTVAAGAGSGACCSNPTAARSHGVRTRVELAERAESTRCRPGQDRRQLRSRHPNAPQFTGDWCVRGSSWPPVCRSTRLPNTWNPRLSPAGNRRRLCARIRVRQARAPGSAAGTAHQRGIAASAPLISGDIGCPAARCLQQAHCGFAQPGTAFGKVRICTRVSSGMMQRNSRLFGALHGPQHRPALRAAESRGRRRPSQSCGTNRTWPSESSMRGEDTFDEGISGRTAKTVKAPYVVRSDSRCRHRTAAGGETRRRRI